MRTMNDGPAVLGLALVMVWACSKNNTSQKALQTEPPPADSSAWVAPPPENPAPSGPIAGSVYDVVSANSVLPPDVVQAMSAYGIEAADRTKFWHTQSLDINDDGSKELLISNVMEWCGSGGCSIWLWQRTRQGLRNLLPSDDITAAAINLENGSTNGYRDLGVYHRAAGTNKEFLLVRDLYVWNGEAYHLSVTTEHGKYFNALLPSTAWKVAP